MAKIGGDDFMTCEWLEDSGKCGRDWSAGIGEPEPSLAITEVRLVHGLSVRVGICSASQNITAQETCSHFIPEDTSPRPHAY